MIGYLKGKIEHIYEDSLILNVNGVGYIVYLARSKLNAKHLHQEISLHIETLIRTEQITLYGFFTIEEKDLFQKLTSVQGVGGRYALSLLSLYTPQDIISFIQTENINLIKKAEGIGPKVANRIVIELKTFASKHAMSSSSGSTFNINLKDTIDTLIQLGYKPQESQKAAEKAYRDTQELNAEKLVPTALKILSQRLL